MPTPVQEKYDSLPPSTQNNARSMFRNDWNWARGNPGREKIFAEKWGLPYESKYTGEAMHSMSEEEIRSWQRKLQLEIEDMTPQELEAYLATY